MKRIWLAFSASLCFIGSAATFALAFKITPLFLMGAIPLLAGFGVIVWYNQVWIDFDNPAELAAVRISASQIRNNVEFELRESLRAKEERIKELSFKSADEHFYLSTMGHRAERDGKINAFKALCFPQFATLNAQYAKSS